MTCNIALARRVNHGITEKWVLFETKAMMGGLCFMTDAQMARLEFSPPAIQAFG
jgi:hypothetical protein